MAEDFIKKETLRLSGVTWSASRQGEIYNGVLPNGLGAINFQYEGNRLVASVDLLEMTKIQCPHIVELFKDNTTQHTSKQFLDMMEAGESNDNNIEW